MPWKHVIGFILSLVLTFVAVGVTLYTDLSLTVILTIIITLGFVQAALQLLMFMHLTEGKDKTIQIWNMVYSIFIGLVIVVGTVWVMLWNMY